MAMIRRYGVLSVIIGLCAIFGACSSGTPGPEGAPDAVDAPTSEVSASKAALQGEDGCLADSDCALGTYCFQEHCAFDCSADVDCTSPATCSERGRCTLDDPEITGDRRAELDETVVRAQLDYEATDPVIYHGAGAETVEIPVEFTGELPAAGIAYRVEVLSCSNDSEDAENDSQAAGREDA
jgi:hypothetical protein